MQVNLVDSPIAKAKLLDEKADAGSPTAAAREDDCIYTVGSVEYSVKHKTTNNNDIAAKIGNAAPKVDEVVGGNENHSVTVVKQNNNPASASEGGGEKKKKTSRMGSIFKKSSKKQQENDNNGGDKEQGSNNNNNDCGNGDQNGNGKKEDAGDSKKDGDKEEDKKDSDKSTKHGHNPTFTPERIQFAKACTLPLHSGSESTAPTTHPSWTPVNGNEFKVRHGPNYPKNGKKEGSLDSLYEVYCVRFFRSEKRTKGGATRIMPLPNIDDDGNSNDVTVEDEGDVVHVGGGEEEGGTAKKNTEDTTANNGVPSSDSDSGTETKRHHHHYPELKGTKIPNVLVVHFMLPYEPPNMFKQRDDGRGGECIYYLKPSQRFLDELSGKIPITPATSLFVKWCSECETDLKMMSRFKCMALVRDIDRHNFGLLKNYNGKPVLITESGRACSGYHGDVRYLEMTANVHYWAFMAKKGFVSIIPKFANMQMEVGFTIEAHSDSEMPECMLGSTVLSYISDGTGPMISKEMQEPVHEHQS